MANKIDLDTIAKEYAEGRISKEDFLYLHKMLTNSATKKKPSAPQPPVLKAAHPAKAPTQQVRQPVQQRAVSPQKASQQRRTMRPQPAQHIPASQNFNQATPAFLVEERKSSIFDYIRRHHKEAVALLGTVGIFISMIYNNFNSPPIESGNGRVMMIHSEQGKQSATLGLRTQDIKLIAELMMEDNSWNKDLIDDFLAQWNHLSDYEKERIKQEDWYNRFSVMLSQQIKIARSKAKTGDVSAIYNQQALLQLTDNLILGNSKEAKNALRKYASSDSDRSSTVSSRKDKQDSVAGKPSSQDKPASQPVQTAKINDKPEKTISSKSSEKNARNDSEHNRHRISRQEIEDVMNRFMVAFEAGHTKDLMALFPDDEYSSSYAELKKVKKDYKDLFRTSRDRRLDLSSFFWEHDFDEARGTAKYKAEIRGKASGADETVTANLDVTLRRLLGKVYITSFKLKNQEIVAHAVPQSGSKPTKSRQQIVSLKNKEKPKHPTPAELQDLVTQYVTAYETGDVTELMHLFASATWTSSRTGLVEMKQNYQNLFTTTNGREMFVKDINWDFKGKKAMGTGELTLTYHTKDDKIVSQKGKIRFVATRNGDTVRFTQMFHIVE
ncbi:YybH family protein [Kaarinaea lacus]